MEKGKWEIVGGLKENELRGLTRIGWGHLACSAWGREVWGVPSSWSTTASRGAAEEEVLISSLWWLAIRHEGMEWSCTRQSSDCTLE